MMMMMMTGVWQETLFSDGRVPFTQRVAFFDCYLFKDEVAGYSVLCHFGGFLRPFGAATTTGGEGGVRRIVVPGRYADVNAGHYLGGRGGGQGQS